MQNFWSYSYDFKSTEVELPPFFMFYKESLIPSSTRVFPRMGILHFITGKPMCKFSLCREITGKFTRPSDETHLPAHVSLEEWAAKPGMQLETQRPLFRKNPWSQTWHLSPRLHCKHPRGQSMDERTHQMRHDEGTGIQQTLWGSASSSKH